MDGATSVPFVCDVSRRWWFLDRLAQDFAPGTTFPEKQVNEVLLRRHDDPALRRYLVEMGFLARDNGSTGVSAAPGRMGAPVLRKVDVEHLARHPVGARSRC